MAVAEDVPQAEGTRGAGRVDRLAAVQIIVNNAIPVVGVWLLGWEPLTPLFFYWLDGLLAIWGLGAVALVVTSREEPRIVKTRGLKAVPTWVAVVGLAFFILAMPSIVTVFAIFGPLHRNAADILRTVFVSYGAWVSLGIALVSHAGQTVGELRWRPEVTLKATGVVRGNFFIHRTLAMAMLAFFGAEGTVSHWRLAFYVLLIAALFTAAQLNPQGYLRMIGFREKRPAAPGTRGGQARRRRGPAREGNDGVS